MSPPDGHVPSALRARLSHSFLDESRSDLARFFAQTEFGDWAPR